MSSSDHTETWGEPKSLSDATHRPWEVQDLALGPAGQIAVIWTGNNGLSYLRHRQEGRWSRIRPIASSYARVVYGPSGVLWVVWAGTRTVRAAPLTHGRWGRVEDVGDAINMVGNGSGFQGSLVLRRNSRGDLLAGWLTRKGVAVSTRPHDGAAWKPAQQLKSLFSEPGMLDAAVGEGGQALVVWALYDISLADDESAVPRAEHLAWSVLTPDGTWTLARYLHPDPHGHASGDTDLVLSMTGPGDATVAWQEGGHPYLAQYDAEHGWTPAVRLPRWASVLQASPAQRGTKLLVGSAAYPAPIAVARLERTALRRSRELGFGLVSSADQGQGRAGVLYKDRRGRLAARFVATDEGR